MKLPKCENSLRFEEVHLQSYLNLMVREAENESNPKTNSVSEQSLFWS